MGAYVKELFTDCAPQDGGTDAAWREPCADGRDEPGHMSSLTSIDELSNEIVHGQLNPRFESPGPIAQMSVRSAAATGFGGVGTQKSNVWG